MIIVVGAMIGAHVFYLAEEGLLSDPTQWLSTTGSTFYGGFVGAGVGIALYVWRRRLSALYLDAIAVGVPLGVAVGRIGDVINGEHYGPSTTSCSACAILIQTRSRPVPSSPTTLAGFTRCCWGSWSSPSFDRCVTGFDDRRCSSGRSWPSWPSDASLSSSCARTLIRLPWGSSRRSG